MGKVSQIDHKIRAVPERIIQNLSGGFKHGAVGNGGDEAVAGGGVSQKGARGR